MNPFKYIDELLDNITMYSLVFFYLLFLSVWAVGLGFLGFIYNSGFELLISIAIIWTSCRIFNYLFSKIFKAPINNESASITAFIIFLIMAPTSSISGAGLLVLTSTLAMASKYILAINKKHVFNPAAFGAVGMSLLGFGGASWWIAHPWMLPAVIVAGLLIIRKLRRVTMFLTFFVTATIVAGFFNLQYYGGLTDFIKNLLISWPIIFFGTIMFTEPLTTPPTKKLRMIYAVIVGVLFSSPLRIGSIGVAHEFALNIGNIFSFAVGMKKRMILKFKEKKSIAKDIYEFVFEPSEKLNFKAGQYLEWTLPHSSPDARGVRRYFTIASSPTENEIKLGTRFAGDKSSSFKKKLLSLVPGNEMAAGQLDGDFVLPADTSKKLIFIAGGIGITPFRSIFKYLIDKNEKRDIVLFYANKSEEDIAFREILSEAETKLGIKTKHVISSYITEEMIKEIPDYKERLFYLSGPKGMVQAYEKLATKMGVPSSQIVTDYFPGY